MEPEKKMPPRNLKGIDKGLKIYGFGIVGYSIRSKSGSMIEIWAQAYNLPGLLKDFRILDPQVICTSEG